MAAKSNTRRRSPLPITALLIVFLALAADFSLRLRPQLSRKPPLDPALQVTSPFELAALPTATHFDFPIGSENGAFAYNAQPFTENRHLGDDLNGIGGENSDLGDPVFAIADGRVLLAGKGGSGWGNVIIVLHAFEDAGTRKYVESLYAHVDTIEVGADQAVKRGERIATVGTAGGRYLAHLHLEMREFTTPFIGPGYRTVTDGWLNPSEFIRQHRGAPDDEVGRTVTAE